MRTMIDLGSQRGPVLHIMDTPTAVDCGREVRLRRSLRSLVECMVPFCCAAPPSSDDQTDAASLSSSDTSSEPHSPQSGVVTGTFFGHRRGRVSLCLQDDTRNPSSSPLTLLELPVPTAALAREMDNGLLRIALESGRRNENNLAAGGSIFGVPVWTTYCNGRKVGFSVRRQVTGNDAAVLRMMRSVSVGAGVLPTGNGEDDVLYLRARFERVTGSYDSESFHMLNPSGSYGQELSIFMLRS